jgi:hypothetical protein
MMVGTTLPFSLQMIAEPAPISNRGQQIDDEFAALLNRKSLESEAPKRKASEQDPPIVVATRPEKQ